MAALTAVKFYSIRSGARRPVCRLGRSLYVLPM